MVLSTESSNKCTFYLF